MEFIIYKDKRDEFRWRLIDKIGGILQESYEGHNNISECQIDIVRFMQYAMAKVIDLESIP